MNCINCGKPHNGHFTMLLGVFKLCRQCETTGTQNENMLKQGIVVESVDQKTGQLVKQTFRS
jgi:hypothetical protein